ARGWAPRRAAGVCDELQSLGEELQPGSRDTRPLIRAEWKTAHADRDYAVAVPLVRSRPVDARIPPSQRSGGEAEVFLPGGSFEAGCNGAAGAIGSQRHCQAVGASVPAGLSQEIFDADRFTGRLCGGPVP